MTEIFASFRVLDAGLPKKEKGSSDSNVDPCKI